MPKRAQTDDTIDPVRSRLAAAAAAPVTVAEPPPKPAPVETPQPRKEQGGPVNQERPTRNPKPKSLPRPGTLTVNRKIMVTEEEAERIESVTAIVSAAFGSKATYSQISRAMWSILAGAEDHIRHGARRAPNLQVPSKGDHIGMAEYEDALADFILTALKRS